MNNKFIIFDNYNNYDHDLIKEYLIEDYTEENEDNLTWINYNPSEEDIQEYASDLERTDWNNTLFNFKEYFNKDMVLITSNSRYFSGFLMTSIDDLLKFIEDCDLVAIREEDDCLYLDFHSSNNLFSNTVELKALNKKGLNILKKYNNDIYDIPEKDIRKLITDNYSEKALFTTVIGWK